MAIAAWLQRLLRRRLDDDDFDAEIRSHLSMAARDRMADGADEDAARLASLKDFGNVTLTREAARGVWTPRWLSALQDQLNDVRYAVRSLAKNPTFSFTVMAVLTLGIGLNAAVFTMLKSLALSPLSGVQRSSQLSTVFTETSAGLNGGISYPDYRYLREHDEAFSGLAGTIVGTINLGRGRNARQIFTEIVSGNYFQVLGVRAVMGRTLLPSDEVAPGRHPVVVLSHALWRRDFNSDADIVGKTVELNNYPLTVVGVADASFHGTIVSYDVEAFVPVMTAPDLGIRFGSQETTPAGILGDRRAEVFYPIGWLRSGTSLSAARAQANALWSAMSHDRPLADATLHLSIVPFWRSPNGAQTYVLPTLILLSTMGLLVLLIACANIAGLVLLRGVSRRGEIAIRLALGATRARIVRLLIVENLVLALPGAVVGVLLARRGIPLLASYAETLAMPARLFFNIEIDSMLIGFAVVVACGSALVFGFVPALQSSRVDLVSVINEDASPRGAARGRLRMCLVVAQVAVSLLLLVGSGLVARSLEAARRANPGFDRDHVTTVAVDVKQNAYDETRGRVFYRQVLDALRRDPGVDSATLAAYDPLAFVDTRSQHVAVDGYTPRKGEDLILMFNAVGSDYFKTLGISVVGGREFGDRDDETGAPVAIVNNTFADRFLGGAANAVGKRMKAADGVWRTVVGVVADIKYLRIDEPPRPYFYLPFFQAYRSSMIVSTRGTGPIDQLVSQARARVVALDPDLPILYARSMRESTRGAIIFLELAAMMLFLFGAAGMALAAMGTYGLVSYLVTQSTHEIGIRMALGATGASVVRGFLARGLRLGAIGVAIGSVAALGVGRLLGSALFGVSATDGVSFARALALVLGGVAVASIVPAWRASRTDPLTALRHH
jgi:predicted permease